MKRNEQRNMTTTATIVIVKSGNYTNGFWAFRIRNALMFTFYASFSWLVGFVLVTMHSTRLFAWTRKKKTQQKEENNGICSNKVISTYDRSYKSVDVILTFMCRQLVAQTWQIGCTVNHKLKKKHYMWIRVYMAQRFFHSIFIRIAKCIGK